MLVAVGGSRVLSWRARLAGRAVVASLLASPSVSLAVGCASGVDELVLSSVLAAGACARLRVFAVGGPSGVGFGSVSAVSAVRAVAGAGASVCWWAGGSGPLRVRLARRSRRAVFGAASGVWVLSSARSRGSLGAALALARAGRPAFLVCCGFSPAALSLPSGAWVVRCSPAAALPPGCSSVRLFAWPASG